MNKTFIWELAGIVLSGLFLHFFLRYLENQRKAS